MRAQATIISFVCSTVSLITQVGTAASGINLLYSIGQWNFAADLACRGGHLWMSR
jgi:hypothetical protein